MKSSNRLRSVPRLTAAYVVLYLVTGVLQPASGQYPTSPPTPATSPPAAAPAAAPASLEEFVSDQAKSAGHRETAEEAGSGPPSLSLTDQPVASVVELHVTGRTTGPVWGTTVYTSDSDVGTAAVHAGVLKDGESGRIKVTVLPGRDSYEASERHGVTSREYGRWGKSFWIESLGPQNEVDSPVTATAMTEFRGQHGRVIIVRVTGRTTGALWGSEVYTDDSDVATAAVHTGILQPGQMGTVRVTILPGRSGYRGSHHHGVTSSSYGAWHGSFWVDQPWYDHNDQHRRYDAP